MATLPQVVPPYPHRQTPITTVVNTLRASRPMSLGVLNQFNNGFYGFIQFLQRNNLLKVLAEPTLVTTSGRPAYFLSGGEMPIPVPQSLGTVSIQFRKFGTQVDFVPIVLGLRPHPPGSPPQDQRNRSDGQHHAQRQHDSRLPHPRVRHRRGNERRPDAGPGRVDPDRRADRRCRAFPT